MSIRVKFRKLSTVVIAGLVLIPGLTSCSLVSFEAHAKEVCETKISEQFDGSFGEPVFDYFEKGSVSVKAGGSFDNGTFACGMERLEGNDLRVNAWTVFGPDGLAVATGGDR